MSYKLGVCDEDDKYRYSLCATTDATSSKKLVVIQCNPSIASSKVSDPTVGKVSFWAEEHGFKEIKFLNLFAMRSPYPSELENKSLADIIGINNDKILSESNDPDAVFILAWGGSLPVCDKIYLQRLCEVKSLLNEREIYRVGGLSYGRYPRHGRMWNKSNRELIRLNWSELFF